MLLTIFTGIEFLFFMLGVFTTLGVMGLIMLQRTYHLDWKSWTSLGYRDLFSCLCHCMVRQLGIGRRAKSSKYGNGIFRNPRHHYSAAWPAICRKVHIQSRSIALTMSVIMSSWPSELQVAKIIDKL